jgi:hypothetical protein
MIAGDRDVDLTEDQLENLLTDKSSHVRLTASSRKDFAPTPEQYRRGLADKSVKVRELYATRFSLSDGIVVDKTKTPTHSLDHDLARILIEIEKLKTWTRRKHELKDELTRRLTEQNYIEFKVDARNALLREFGQHTIIDVPHDKRGHLSVFRGRKAHLVCLGHGTYSTIYFSAKGI